MVDYKAGFRRSPVPFTGNATNLINVVSDGE
jgi:hypothetical protein